MSLDRGDIAPDFETVDTDGARHKLSELCASGPVILAFFPKAFTPGWTREIKSYRDRYDELKGQNVTILAISADKQAKQADFKRTLGAQFSFVADADGELIRLFDVKTPLVTFAKRTTFVIGKERRILYVEHGSSATDSAGAAAACTLW